MKIIAATKNKDKIKEITEIFKPLGFEVVSQEDEGINVDIEETGDTFAKNALIKARAVAMLCDDYVIADDSGLCVDALGGKPGVYSARYAGEGAGSKELMDKLLTEMEGKENRKAHFVTNIAFIYPDGTEMITQGEVNGRILNAPEGENGFGYDPIFYATELGKSFGMATAAEKNSVSHRSRALSALFDEIKNLDLGKIEL